MSFLAWPISHLHAKKANPESSRVVRASQLGCLSFPIGQNARMNREYSQPCTIVCNSELLNQAHHSMPGTAAFFCKSSSHEADLRRPLCHLRNVDALDGP